MNYSFIKFAQKQLTKLEDKCLEWRKKVSLSLYTLTKTNFSEEQRGKMHENLLEHTKFIIEEVGKVLDGLKEVRFSESQAFLHEEKKHLIQRYEELIGNLNKIKNTISQQVEKKIMIVTPLRRKVVKRKCCYFCDVSIADDFAFKLKGEEQQTLGVEIPEGAAFCSQRCLWGYCDEYEKREKLRQEEKERISKKVERDREIVTEIQGQIADFTERINKLERKEKELELFPESNQVESPEKVGFFRRLGQKLGLAKKPNPLSKLERVKKLKRELNTELEKNEEKLKRSLIILSLDEQKEKERERLEKKFVLEKEKIAADKITTFNEEEETFDD